MTLRISLRFSTYASSLVLLGALGVLGAPEAGAVVIIPEFPACPGQTGEDRTSVVFSDTFETTPGNYSYNFQVCNTSGGGEQTRPNSIRDWELPWDQSASAVVTNIRSPGGWSWNIETIGIANPFTGWDGVAAWQNAGPPADPMYTEFPAFRTHTEVLHWYSCEFFSAENCQAPGNRWIAPGGSLEGFGFDATVAPTAGPYQASWIVGPVRTGDPDVPGGPGVPFNPTAVAPEPTGLALFALGLGALMAGRRRKQEPKS